MVSPLEVRPWAWPASTGVRPPDPGSSITSAGSGAQLLGSLRPLIGPLDPVVANVGAPGPKADGERHGDAESQVDAELAVARLRHAGVALVWGEGRPVESLDAWEELNRARGASAVASARARPDLLAYLQVGSWFNAGWRTRAVRRALLGARRVPSTRHGADAAALWRLRGDLAFWSGVRQRASAQEWRRWTLCSYVVVMYHRLAGARVPGQEQMDISPARFEAHMRLLRLLGYRPLGADDLRRFHADPDASLPRRSYLVTLDDAYRDNAGPLPVHAAHRPVVFAPTAMVGATATFAADEPLLSWDELRELEEPGVVVGSHGRHHLPLEGLADASLVEELEGSWSDLTAQLRAPTRAVAYPHGSHDAATVRRAEAAGYDVGFTSLPGRNGAGTHPRCLRRIGIWRGDNRAFALWKLVTGEYVPGQPRSAGRGVLTLVQPARRADHAGGELRAPAAPTPPTSEPARTTRP